jgi:hypothetical protein
VQEQYGHGFKGPPTDCADDVDATEPTASFTGRPCPQQLALPDRAVAQLVEPRGETQIDIGGGSEPGRRRLLCRGTDSWPGGFPWSWLFRLGLVVDVGAWWISWTSTSLDDQLCAAGLWRGDYYAASDRGQKRAGSGADGTGHGGEYARPG